MSNSVDMNDNALSMKDVVAIIIKTRKIHEGHYVPAIEFNFGAGMDGPSEEDIVPTMRIGIKSFNISRIDTPTPFSVDASIANPKRIKKQKTE